MKIILLKDVKKVGRKYDIKEVADGYALNMLIPAKMAIPATPGNTKMVEVKKASENFELLKTEKVISEALNKIKASNLSILGKVNEQGHLFAGIHKEQIVEEIKKVCGVDIDPEMIILEHPIKEVGEYSIVVKLGQREDSFKLIIKAQD